MINALSPALPPPDDRVSVLTGLGFSFNVPQQVCLLPTHPQDRARQGRPLRHARPGPPADPAARRPPEIHPNCPYAEYRAPNYGPPNKLGTDTERKTIKVKTIRFS